jgi:hypothetical protein
MWRALPGFAWRCEVYHENSWCSLLTSRDLNLGSPECDAGMIHNGLRRSFSREVGETGYSRALQLWAFAWYVSEMTGSLVGNATGGECLMLCVERSVVRSLNWLDWVQSLNIGIYSAIVPTDRRGVQVLWRVPTHCHISVSGRVDKSHSFGPHGFPPIELFSDRNVIRQKNLNDFCFDCHWKMLWNGNECGENKSNENFKTTITSKNYDRPKTTRECGIF